MALLLFPCSQTPSLPAADPSSDRFRCAGGESDFLAAEPIEPPWPAIREWIPDADAERGGVLFDQRPDSGKLVESRFAKAVPSSS